MLVGIDNTEIDVVDHIGLGFSSSALCRTELMESYCSNLSLLWNILVSLPMVTESFAGYSSLASEISWSL